ncbi:MAG TPA: hypothetical protein VJ810_25115 [Blastocatellia bacterium]|nr:hypothetical protein [Blastocatellia bacterium]
MEEKEGWTPTQGASHRLLNWLGGERKYEEMRRRLVEYFDRRGCLTPKDLADDTFERVMKYLDKKNKDYDEEPAKLCFTTARFVFLEYSRGPIRTQVSLDSITHEPSVSPDEIAVLEEEREEKEKRLDCLEKCSQKLPADDLDLIVRFHSGEGPMKLNRQALAADRGISAGVLRIRAHRIRTRLRDCVTKCISVKR